MKKIIWIALLIFFNMSVAAPAHSSEKADWTWTDTGLQVTYLTLHTMDWTQTLHIARNPDKYYEMNQTLGRHPSEGRVNSYFAATALLNTGAAWLLPKPWRTMWQVGFIVDRYAYVQHNRRIGIGISLHF